MAGITDTFRLGTKQLPPIDPFHDINSLIFEAEESNQLQSICNWSIEERKIGFSYQILILMMMKMMMNLDYIIVVPLMHLPILIRSNMLKWGKLGYIILWFKICRLHVINFSSFSFPPLILFLSGKNTVSLHLIFLLKQNLDNEMTKIIP